ncbi:MAG: tetratricopeptide repeat protein [Bacteroidales bacterium]|nr:tetratricopeptide repeat protein [Bacteroidales bacterium]
MATKSKTKEEVRQEQVENQVSKFEQFYNKYKNVVWGVIAAIVIIWLAILAYQKFVYQPRCEAAREQAYPAENNFQQGEYDLALNGDGNVLGFAEIIDTYGSKAGKAVYLYAGLCELQLGNFEDAVSYLKKYNGKEPILAARAQACLGDAYVGLENYKDAVAAYKKAVAKADNYFAASYLVKEGLALEKLGDKAAALGCYKTVKDKYPQSIEAFDIDRYIAAVEE